MSQAIVHAALTAAHAYGDKVAELQVIYKGKTPEVIRAALLPQVASFPKYSVPLIKGEGKAKGTKVLDSSHANYEACRKALGRLVKDIVGGKDGKAEEIEVPAEVAAAAAKLAKLCAAYEGARKLAATAISEAFAK